MKHQSADSDPSRSTPRSPAGHVLISIDIEKYSERRQEPNMADQLLEEIDRLIERSSLGAPAAKSLRNSTPIDAVRPILDRADSIDNGPFTVGIEILPYELIGVLTDHHGGCVAVGDGRCPAWTSAWWPSTWPRSPETW